MLPSQDIIAKTKSAGSFELKNLLSYRPLQYLLSRLPDNNWSKVTVVRSRSNLIEEGGFFKGSSGSWSSKELLRSLGFLCAPRLLALKALLATDIEIDLLTLKAMRSKSRNILHKISYHLLKLQ